MKKIYFIMGMVLLMFHPLWAGVKVVKDSETGYEYNIYTPDIIYPEITLPDIQKMTIQEIMLIKPKQLVYIIQKASIEEIQTISPEKLAIIIFQIEQKDLDEVLKKIAPSGYWMVDQKEFYDTWKKKDIKQMTKIIEQAQKKEIPFIIGWSNYQNFDKINWSRKEAGFNCRQVLISHMSYDWKDKFKPQGDIILTIDFGLSSYEIKALLEMIQENKEKIKLIFLPHAGYIPNGISSNNFINRDPSTFPIVAEYFDKLAYSINKIAPDILIYLTVSLTSETFDAWVNSFKYPYDGIALWNVLTTKGNLKKAYEIASQYNKNIILGGVYGNNPDTDGWLEFNKVKEMVFQDIEKVKEVGFQGLIIMTNEQR